MSNKRSGSPLLDVNEQMFKRSCGVTTSSQIDGKKICSDEESAGNGLENEDTYPNSFREGKV